MKTVEPNALLLQVMAHDLLAPLTAVKWQVELLNKHNLDPVKREQYLENIADSTSLGIALTKHAHVAASVLIGTYKRNDEQGSLSTVIRTAVHNLILQYERHGISLETDIHDDTRTRTVDRELIGLLVWSIAKFFLTCTPANTAVSIRGMPSTYESGPSRYTLFVSAPDIPDRDAYVAQFNAREARDQYDQTHVFTTLIHTVAPLLSTHVAAHTQENLLALEASFEGE